jgi:hypothetical protein
MAGAQKRRRPLARLMGVGLGIWAPSSFAALFQPALLSGVMQQPTSSYYHLIYGAQADFGSSDGAILLRGSYFERPAFKRVGYVDQDYGWSALLGSKLASTKSHGFFAFFGAGRVAGYIKPVTPVEDGSSQSRSFNMPGLTASMEYKWLGDRLFLGAGHQTIICFGDSAQTEAFVAWPFSLFTLSVGAGW